MSDGLVISEMPWVMVNEVDMYKFLPKKGKKTKFSDRVLAPDYKI